MYKPLTTLFVRALASCQIEVREGISMAPSQIPQLVTHPVSVTLRYHDSKRDVEIEGSVRLDVDQQHIVTAAKCYNGNELDVVVKNNLSEDVLVKIEVDGINGIYRLPLSAGELRIIDRHPQLNKIFRNVGDFTAINISVYAYTFGHDDMDRLSKLPVYAQEYARRLVVRYTYVLQWSAS